MKGACKQHDRIDLTVTHPNGKETTYHDCKFLMNDSIVNPIVERERREDKKLIERLLSSYLGDR